MDEKEEDESEEKNPKRIEKENFNLQNKIDLFEKDTEMFQSKYIEEKNRKEQESREKIKYEQKNKYLHDILFLFRLRDFF